MLFVVSAVCMQSVLYPGVMKSVREALRAHRLLRVCYPLPGTGMLFVPGTGTWYVCMYCSCTAELIIYRALQLSVMLYIHIIIHTALRSYQ